MYNNWLQLSSYHYKHEFQNPARDNLRKQVLKFLQRMLSMLLHPGVKLMQHTKIQYGPLQIMTNMLRNLFLLKYSADFSISV